MIKHYFEDSEVKDEYKKEYISLFSGWLGTDNLYKLDEVTEKEWSKFNALLTELNNNYKLYSVNTDDESCSQVKDIDELIDTYNESMNKEASQFIKLIIPELNCVITEAWDYTYILWHKDSKAIETLSPIIKNVGLYQFNEKNT